MEYIEFSAKTVEDAITNASVKFGVTRDKLDYVVVEKGSAGFLGIFSKPAIIKARAKDEVDEFEQAVKGELNNIKTVNKADNRPEKKNDNKSDNRRASKNEIKNDSKPQKQYDKKPVKAENVVEKKNVEKAAEKKAPVKNVNNSNNAAVSVASNQDTNVNPTEVKEVTEAVTEKPARKSVAGPNMEPAIKKFLSDVLKAMDMEAEVKVTIDENTSYVNVELIGKEMGVLIGKRGQTLDSLQYLVSLVANKEAEGYFRVKLDTENYRERRKETLESLARNIAYKVKRTRRPVSLEPMNPYERRIIHSSLQNDKYVSTRSEGEEPFRHVVVYLKRN